MTIPKSAEFIRRLELSLDELTPKFESRLQLIREDLKSLISDIENLKNLIDENRRKSNDYTREISDLNSDLQTFNEEITQIEREISKSLDKINSINNQATELHTELSADRNSLATLESEKSTLLTNLKSLEEEATSLKSTHDELQPKFDSQMSTLNQKYENIKAKRDRMGNRFKATRLLCSEDYIQSPEVGLVKFLAKKPSPSSTITEIRSALGLDQNTLVTILRGLAARGALEFDEAVGNINILQKIDLFDEKV
jgi:chromosome segregation ATPase